MHSLARRGRMTAGFTLVELLVVIAIIGMLVALLVPAVNAARARMRKATCLNNVGEIGMAIISYDSSKQFLPGYVQSVKARGRASRTPGFVAWIPGGGSGIPPYVNSRFLLAENAPDSQIGWPAMILSDIDREDLWELITGAENGSTATSEAPVEQQTVPKIELFVCPDDSDLNSIDDAAGITYSVNSGAWDNGNFPGLDSKDNGLFHNRVFGNVRNRLSQIQDGTGTTLMVAENVTKNENYSWLGVQQGGEQQFGLVWVANTNPDSECTNDGQYLISDDAADVFAPGTWDVTQPCFARPASYHANGSFNAAFADGHGESISKNIDYIVYQQLLTPNGAKCIDPSGSNPSAIAAFRSAPPLSESSLE